ncbi:hypothetical protein HYC85_030030 [Camellia sinensis]|uniref:Uncharacterized protein n=1 Tax=Camellia sinensis TaxID=4442 RepID=A0A7J7FZR2_CAMSI|nr:hypothetical protein HYC85_030030 [Camellia sinensis]
MVNDCLLAKWWWRYGCEDRSLWKSILISKYGSAGGKWLPFIEDGQQSSKIWGDILNTAVSNTQLYSFYVANCEIQVGNGTRIRFWEDHWMGEKCFKEEYPRLFELSLEKEVPLSHLVERKRITARWDLKFRRRLRAWEELEVVRLVDKLNSNTPCLTEKADALVWKASSNGLFSTAAAYNKLTSRQVLPATERRIKSRAYLQSLGLLDQNTRRFFAPISAIPAMANVYRNCIAHKSNSSRYLPGISRYDCEFHSHQHTGPYSNRHTNFSNYATICTSYDPDTMTTSISRARVLVFPYLAPGHMMPLLDLTNQLATRGLTIIILVTPKNLSVLNPLLSKHPSIKTLGLPFPAHPSLSTRAENVKDLPPIAFPGIMLSMHQLFTSILH